MNFHNVIVMAVFVVGIVFFSHGSLAQSGVPVIEASETGVTNQATSNASFANKVDSRSTTDSTAAYQQISQQVQNIVNMNLPQQINALQRSIQELQGQLEVQQHNLELLNIQQRSFYEDLNQRINQMTTLSSSSSNTSVYPATKSVQPAKTQASNQLPNIKTNETSMYQNAFQLIMQKQYSDAQNALNKYLTQYPKGNHADSAHYWLGEIYLLQNQLTLAIKEFETVINQYKTSNKIPDAKFKLASINLQQGKIGLAKKEMLELKKDYPNSTAAQLASIQLQQLNKTNDSAITTNS